mgnify:CR=1 FL=1
MSIAFLISALLLGLASSLHCVGMCGPLVMSVPVQHLPENKKISGVLIYQTGRIAICTTIIRVPFYPLSATLLKMKSWLMMCSRKYL